MIIVNIKMNEEFIISAESKKKISGFTLLEVLIVVALIVGFFTVFIFRLNPIKIINSGVDAQIINNINVIKDSIEEYSVSRRGFLPTVEGELLPIVDETNITTDGILVQNLEDIIPDFLVINPNDLDLSEYYVGQLESGGILVGAETSDGSIATSTARVGNTQSTEKEIVCHFNSFSFETFDIDSNNVIDGNVNTCGQDNDSGESMILSSHNCNTNLGNIRKVELRFKWAWNNPTQTWAYITPYFNGTSQGSIYEATGNTGSNLGSGGQYTQWWDITEDINAPTDWEWTDLQNLDTGVGLIKNWWGLMRIYIVELKVTYI